MALFVGSFKKNIQRWNCLFAVSIYLLGILVSCSKSDSAAEILPAAESEIYFSKSLDFASDSGEKAITFTTNKDWKIEISQSGGDANWCSVSPMEGKAGTNTVKIKTTANTTYDDRNMTLCLIVEELTKKIVVTQKQKDALTLATAKYEVGVEGGTIQVEVKANIDYEVQIPEQYAGWIHRTADTRGLSASTVSFTIDKSEEYDKREGEIIIKSGEMSESLKVYQAGSAVLLLTKNEYTLSDEGGQITVDLNSNFEYEVQMPQADWITSTTTRGISSHTLHYIIAPNSAFNSRTAEIIYYDKNSTAKAVVKVFQNPLILALEESEVELMVGSGKQLAYKLNPIAGSDNLVWNSSDASVVTVSRNGTLTAVKKGSAVITVATSDGLHRASCIVAVKAIEDYISFSISSSIISVGGYINKSVSSIIKNQSKGSIQLLKLTAKHPVTMVVISTTTDASLLGILKPGESKTLGLNNLREDITPVFIWEYIFEGKRYANHELIGGAGTDTPGGTVDDMPWN